MEDNVEKLFDETLFMEAFEISSKVFPELINDPTLSQELTEFPMGVIAYCYAVDAYSQHSNITTRPDKFPNLQKLAAEDSISGLNFRSLVNSANLEYSEKKDVNNGGGIEALKNNVDRGYKKELGSNIEDIATKYMTWNLKEQKQDIGIELDDDPYKLFAAERIGEMIDNYTIHFNDFMEKPKFALAATEYLKALKTQKPEQTLPSYDELLVHSGVKKVETALDMVDYANAEIKVLNKVSENPQEWFENEGFSNTKEFMEKNKDKTTQKLSLSDLMLRNSTIFGENNA